MQRNRNETKNEETQAGQIASRGAKSYDPPRIITHSSQQLEKASVKINACTSFLP